VKIKELEKLFEMDCTNEIEWHRLCHDCREEINVVAIRRANDITLIGGAVYNPEIDGQKEFFLKCDACFKKDSTLRSFFPVETYSRVVGYLRPVGQWNGAKAQEFEMRQEYKESA